MLGLFIGLVFGYVCYLVFVRLLRRLMPYAGEAGGAFGYTAFSYAANNFIVTIPVMLHVKLADFGSLDGVGSKLFTASIIWFFVSLPWVVAIAAFKNRKIDAVKKLWAVRLFVLALNTASLVTYFVYPYYFSFAFYCFCANLFAFVFGSKFLVESHMAEVVKRVDSKPMFFGFTPEFNPGIMPIPGEEFGFDDDRAK